MQSGRIWFFVVAIIVTALAWAVVAKVRYEWCLGTEMTHKQCVFQAACG